MDSVSTRRVLPHDLPPWVFGVQTYLLTVCTHPRGGNQLCREATASHVRESLDWRHERHEWTMLACVLMPDHVHLLVQVPETRKVQKLMSDWKRYLRTRAGIRWQRDFFERRLRRDEHFVAKLEYLRQNPVRARLVASASDWPYFWTW
jgi:putative transposase